MQPFVYVDFHVTFCRGRSCSRAGLVRFRSTASTDLVIVTRLLNFNSISIAAACICVSIISLCCSPGGRSRRFSTIESSRL